MKETTALLLVDLQNDFCPGGALAVSCGDEVIAVANQEMAGETYGLVVASLDWHPEDHGSFARSHPGHEIGEQVTLSGLPQILWPVHCVEGSHGAEFHASLDRNRIDHVVKKGRDREYDSYSAFFDNGHIRQTDLKEILDQSGIRRLVVMGLATDYCVKYTVLDALSLGYDVTLLEQGCRAVNLSAGDGDRAIEEMVKAGAVVG